jgi:hypothetical protein
MFDTEFAQAVSRTAAALCPILWEINNNYRVSPETIRLDSHVTSVIQ